MIGQLSYTAPPTSLVMVPLTVDRTFSHQSSVKTTSGVMVKNQGDLGSSSLEAPFSQVTLDCVRLAIKKNPTRTKGIWFI